MDDNSRDRLTLARRFLEPANATHRQYEAIQVFFVEGVPSAEVVTQLGYTPGSFRVLLHEFRNQPERDAWIPTGKIKLTEPPACPRVSRYNHYSYVDFPVYQYTYFHSHRYLMQGGLSSQSPHFPPVFARREVGLDAFSPI